MGGLGFTIGSEVFREAGIFLHRIESISAQSVADRAGLLVGDYVTSVSGCVVLTVNHSELSAWIQRHVDAETSFSMSVAHPIKNFNTDTGDATNMKSKNKENVQEVQYSRVLKKRKSDGIPKKYEKKSKKEDEEKCNQNSEQNQFSTESEVSEQLTNSKIRQTSNVIERGVVAARLVNFGGKKASHDEYADGQIAKKHFQENNESLRVNESAPIISEAGSSKNAKSKLIDGDKYTNTRLTNRSCFTLKNQPTCDVCSKNAYSMESYKIDDNWIHKKCFRCILCQTALSPTNYAAIDSRSFCKTCFKKSFTLKGNYDGLRKNRA